MSALSVGYGCSIKPARGTGNFNLKFWFVWQPAQIHIHVQMRLAGTSLCQRCLLPDEIPGAPNSLYYASVLRRTVQTSCQTLERLFLITKRKTNCLVTAEFCVRNQTPLFDGKIFLSNALLIFQPSKWWNQTARQIHTLTILRTNSLLASCPVFPDRMFSYNSPAKTSRLKRRAASGDSIEAALALLEIIGTSA